MITAPRHLSTAELEHGLPEVLASPHDDGHLVAIVVRPAVNERRVLAAAQLTSEGGIDGDRWASEPSPDPAGQISLMNSRFLRQIAGHDDAVSLAGDNLIVDFDLSEGNLPPGSRLAIGEVVVEVNDTPHTGCGKFQQRYGVEARAFMNNARGMQLHLRGRYGRVVAGGTIAVGDAILKQASE